MQRWQDVYDFTRLRVPRSYMSRGLSDGARKVYSAISLHRAERAAMPKLTGARRRREAYLKFWRGDALSLVDKRYLLMQNVADLTEMETLK